MIQATELRLQNYVKDQDGLIVIIKGIDGDRQYVHKGKTYLGTAQCYYIEYNGTTGKWLETLEPIPLTEEILLKCGFVRQRTTPHIMELIVPELGEEGYIEHIDGNFTLTKEGSEYYNDYFALYDRIKHLHQLQNLHFALTGKELKINLHNQK